MSDYLSWHAPPRESADGALHALATLLRAAGAGLDRLAGELETRRMSLPQPGGRLEFHAEAGAPEGALYVDGRLVGWIEGVKRL